MIGWNGLQVVAGVLTVLLLPGALVRLWQWALERPGNGPEAA